MKKRISPPTLQLTFFILFTILLHSSRVNACLNVHYSLDKEGHFHETEGYREPFAINFDFEKLEKNLLTTEKKLLKEKTYKLLSDYAVYLLKGGKTEEALQIFISLAYHFPDQYELAANLGTAYELSGNPDSALVYIQKGMKLNPNAHEGSEWVHVKILETKIKQKTQPDYLVSNTVLNLSADQEKDPKICDQILIQLHERFPFCPGPDSIMASLLVDLGDCYANTVSIEIAKGVYELAQKYYGDESESTKNKIAEMKKLSREYDTRSTKIVDEGESIKEGTFTHKKLMEDFNDPPYEIKWEKINTDVDSLLGIIGLTQVVFEPAPMPEQADSLTTIEAASAEPKTQPTTNDNSLIYFISFGLLALILYILFVVKRNRK
jgi:tetratricopeptide (TPR) repeat protein